MNTLHTAYLSTIWVILLLLIPLLVSPNLPAIAQGLIGTAPDDYLGDYDVDQRKKVKSLQIEISKLTINIHKGLPQKPLYAALLWELAMTYYNLCRWDKAESCYQALFALKLPPKVIVDAYKKRFNISYNESVIQIRYKCLQENKIASSSPDIELAWANLCKEAKDLQLEAVQLGVDVRKGLPKKPLYGAILWKLAQTNEALSRWDKAESCYQAIFALKLPPRAVINAYIDRFEPGSDKSIYGYDERSIQFDYRHLQGTKASLKSIGEYYLHH